MKKTKEAAPVAEPPDRRPKPKLVVAIPASVGAAIDHLAKTRDERKALEAKAAAIKETENAIEEAIFAKFKKQDLDGARGKRAQASIKRSDVPTLDDWDAFARHLTKHPEDLDLLQRRLGLEACRARWELKKTIPGVGLYTRISLSLTKVKR